MWFVKQQLKVLLYNWLPSSGKSYIRHWFYACILPFGGSLRCLLWYFLLQMRFTFVSFMAWKKYTHSILVTALCLEINTTVHRLSLWFTVKFPFVIHNSKFIQNDMQYSGLSELFGCNFTVEFNQSSEHMIAEWRTLFYLFQNGSGFPWMCPVSCPQQYHLHPIIRRKCVKD